MAKGTDEPLHFFISWALRILGLQVLVLDALDADFYSPSLLSVQEPDVFDASVIHLQNAAILLEMLF